MALHILSARTVVTASDGDHADGGGLFLRIRNSRSSWLLRYTGPDGKRHDMGLGRAHRDTLASAGESLKRARERSRRAHDTLATHVDPLERKRAERAAAEAKKAVEKAARKAEQLTLCRAARDYHERAVEPRFTARHARNWISSLEHHIPASVWHAPIDAIGPVRSSTRWLRFASASRKPPTRSASASTPFSTTPSSTVTARPIR